MLRVHSPDDSTFLRKMTSWPLKLWRHVRYPTLINRWQTCQISCRSDFKRGTGTLGGSLRIFWRGLLQQRESISTFRAYQTGDEFLRYNL